MWRARARGTLACFSSPVSPACPESSMVVDFVINVTVGLRFDCFIYSSVWFSIFYKWFSVRMLDWIFEFLYLWFDTLILFGIAWVLHDYDEQKTVVSRYCYKTRHMKRDCWKLQNKNLRNHYTHIALHHISSKVNFQGFLRIRNY